MRQALVNYFTFRGRLSRGQYWFWYQFPVLLLCLAGMAVFMVQYPNIAAIFGSGGQIDPDAISAALVPVQTPFLKAASVSLDIFQVPIYVALLSATVRRYHDRGKSGWWTLIALIPFFGTIWFLVETNLMKGTLGPNLYGPDPIR